MAQARSIAEDNTFAIPHPFPEADPDGVAFPLDSSLRIDGGHAPLPKKPVYTLLLAGADLAVGVPGMMIVSIAGTVIAATFAALVARRLHPSLALPTLWLTGAASPLVADAYLAIAHALAAGVCAAALLAVASALDRRTFARLALVAAPIAAAITLRSEALLFGVALALALLASAGLRRDRWTAWVGAAAVVGLGAGVVIDRAVTNRLLGASGVAIPATSGGSEAGSFLSGRAKGFVTTLLRPGYGAIRPTGLLMIVLLLGGLLVVRELRRDDPDRRFVRSAAAIIIGVALLVLVVAMTGDPQIVPGLLVAFPVGVWGIVALDRATIRHPLGEVLALTATLFALAVLATQYAQGGAWEWGWRYFAIGLPCVTPLVAAGLRRLSDRVDADTARVWIASIAAAAIALAVMGTGSVGYFRDGWRDFVAATVAIAERTDPGDGGGPVVVATEPELPRAAWDEMEGSRWLLVAPEDVAAMLERLHDLGVRELVVATKGPEVQPVITRSAYAVEGDAGAPGDEEWWVTIVVAR
jgi:hypothetical protein